VDLTIVVVLLLVAFIVAPAVSGIRGASRSVNVSAVSSRTPPEVRAWIFGSLIPALARSGYRLESQTETQLDLVRVYRTGLVRVLTVLLFPVGLAIFFFCPQRRVLTVFVQPRPDGGTQLRISGEAQRVVADQLKAISDRDDALEPAVAA
jgi:hypothetical protein